MPTYHVTASPAYHVSVKTEVARRLASPRNPS